MSCITYSVNGVPLDDPDGRWELKKGTTVGVGAGLAAVSNTVPGVHGALLGGAESFNEAGLVLRLQANGKTFGEMRRHYSALAAVLSPTKPVEVVRTVDGVALSQLARGRTVSEPEFSASRKSLTFDATMRLPGVFWRGEPVTWDFPGATNGGEYDVTALAGSDGPINDALFLIHGPVNQPRVESDGLWFELGLSLTSSQKALVNSADWSVRVGAGTTFNGGGTLRKGALVASSARPYVLPLLPTYTNDPTLSSVRLRFSGGSGFSGATGVAVRARPSFVG